MGKLRFAQNKQNSRANFTPKGKLEFKFFSNLDKKNIVSDKTVIVRDIKIDAIIYCC